jgi:iron(III) transport system ATP-binding protein
VAQQDALMKLMQDTPPTAMDTKPKPDRHAGRHTQWPPAAPVAGAAGVRSDLLVLQHITQAYDRVKVIDNLSLTLAGGEIVALVGHSGSGKSTLLRVIAGLERPREGRIVIDGSEVFAPGLNVPTERRGVGMMFQDYALFPHLTVIENVKFGVRHLEAGAAHRHAGDALDRIGLGSRSNDYPHALSGGEQQRVALIRALLPGPRILLMDEPFSNLDRRNRDTIRDQTARILRDSGTTVVVVTHEPEDAMRMTDRVMLLQEGRIVQDGPAVELYRNPASLLVARFFSEYNEVTGTCSAGFVDTPIGRFAAPDQTEGAAVVVCIRPHDIHIVKDGESTLNGTIMSHAFVGDEQMVALWMPGLQTPLNIRAPVHIDVPVGDTIKFRLRSEDALIFSAIS